MDFKAVNVRLGKHALVHQFTHTKKRLTKINENVSNMFVIWYKTTISVTFSCSVNKLDDVGVSLFKYTSELIVLINYDDTAHQRIIHLSREF